MVLTNSVACCCRYMRINYQGTLNVINACKKHGVGKLVMSSSPSTRFTGADIDGLSEDDLPDIPMKKYLQAYAGSKAAGELACREACSDELLTVAVAPHQVCVWTASSEQVGCIDFV